MKINNQLTKIKGFSLVEMIVYIAILTIFTAGIVVIVVSLFKTKHHLEAREEIAYSATLTLERITREIRRAQSINIFSSNLNTNPGLLTLNTTDTSDNPTTITLSLVSNTLYLQEGSNTPTPLSVESVTISNLIFTRYTTSQTEGVLIEITAEKDVQGTVTSNKYRTFVVLDGS